MRRTMGLAGSAGVSSAWIVALALAIFAGAPPAPADAGSHDRILARADALVTVKFVLNVKMEGAGADREFDGEITCLVIDADGLVLCSNTELGGYVGLMSQLMGGGAGFTMSAAPKEMEVLIGDASEGLEAALVARDSDRDLAWVRIEEELPERPLDHLDLGRSAELSPGEKFYRLRRMDKFFGRAPLVEEGVVGAVIDRPRKLLVPSVPAAGGFGLPVFTAAGELVGVTVLQMPGAGEGAELMQGSLPFLSSTAKLQDMIGGLILPAAEVVKATRLAREVAAEGEEE